MLAYLLDLFIRLSGQSARLVKLNVRLSQNAH
jgi:hypothetical protein